MSVEALFYVAELFLVVAWINLSCFVYFFFFYVILQMLCTNLVRKLVITIDLTYIPYSKILRTREQDEKTIKLNLNNKEELDN